MNQTLKRTWTELMSRNSFEWFASLTFRDQVSSSYARKTYIDWIRNLCVQEHMQVASMTVYNPSPHPHLHSVILGTNKGGRALNDVSCPEWERKWNRNPKAARIELIRGLNDVAAYLAFKNLDVNSNFQKIGFPTIRSFSSKSKIRE